MYCLYKSLGEYFNSTSLHNAIFYTQILQLNFQAPYNLQAYYNLIWKKQK